MRHHARPRLCGDEPPSSRRRKRRLLDRVLRELPRMIWHSVEPWRPYRSSLAARRRRCVRVRGSGVNASASSAFNQKFRQLGLHLVGLNRPSNSGKQPHRPSSIARSHALWTSIMKSDFSIGDRVQISALGALRCPGIAERTGTIVGRSAYVNCARVLLDGNKSPTTINLNYLKEILSANAEVSAS